MFFLPDTVDEMWQKEESVPILQLSLPKPGPEIDGCTRKVQTKGATVACSFVLVMRMCTSSDMISGYVQIAFNGPTFLDGFLGTKRANQPLGAVEFSTWIFYDCLQRCPIHDKQPEQPVRNLCRELPSLDQKLA